MKKSDLAATVLHLKVSQRPGSAAEFAPKRSRTQQISTTEYSLTWESYAKCVFLHREPNAKKQHSIRSYLIHFLAYTPHQMSELPSFSCEIEKWNAGKLLRSGNSSLTNH